MLDVSRMAGDSVKSLFFSNEGKCYRASLVSGSAACGAEVPGDPVVEAAAVGDESREAANERPDGWTGEFTGEEMEPNEVSENEKEEKREEGENVVVSHWIWKEEVNLVKGRGKIS